MARPVRRFYQVIQGLFASQGFALFGIPKKRRKLFSFDLGGPIRPAQKKLGAIRFGKLHSDNHPGGIKTEKLLIFRELHFGKLRRNLRPAKTLGESVSLPRQRPPLSPSTPRLGPENFLTINVGDYTNIASLHTSHARKSKGRFKGMSKFLRADPRRVAALDGGRIVQKDAAGGGGFYVAAPTFLARTALAAFCPARTAPSK